MGLSSLPHRKMREDAFVAGKKLFQDIESGKTQSELTSRTQNRTESCPNSMFLWGSEFMAGGKIMMIPCGLTSGSHITVVGTPRLGHEENDPKITLMKDDDETVMVSQFMMELQGLKTVDGEDPPRILHFNPRLKGDWSGRPVIEQNTCYRMQWGSAMRCDGWKSKPMDGQVKCEKWIRDDDDHSEESKATWWLKRLIGGRTKKVSIDWPYPFVENKLFVLTVSAGLEGYHINVDGRHITSFPYCTGFTLEDATGLFVNGDIDVHSIFAASLPSTHPNEPVELFIGILSAGNHFSERMAVRKFWMQHPSLKSPNVVAPFFVAMHGRKEINLELMKEAEFFGDIVIVPYMDNCDLVVLKTVAICEYEASPRIKLDEAHFHLGFSYPFNIYVLVEYSRSVQSLQSNVMKCDDDTFVRIDAVMKEVKKVHSGRSLFPHGDWQEWPEEDFPPYANGPGYIISFDIADHYPTAIILAKKNAHVVAIPPQTNTAD
ncbi:hypothetical protein RND71_003054 [Anisodus tanguticus]|uniref:Hexosyltransferase n=1 Tax=Anisodus tanguticus TaxID=243964 RepID=A0AAE1SW27_9SOLA|nr:hypothetical protein RND71_003054 [Anisodus tanguticus]